jgi:hypothetical protein
VTIVSRYNPIEPPSMSLPVIGCKEADRRNERALSFASDLAIMEFVLIRPIGRFCSRQQRCTHQLRRNRAAQMRSSAAFNRRVRSHTPICQTIRIEASHGSNRKLI